MRKLNFSIESVREYYGKFFAEDLERYLMIEGQTDWRDYRMITSVTARPDGTRRKPSAGLFGGYPAIWRYPLYVLISGEKDDNAYPTLSDTTECNFIFSGIFLCMILAQQGLRHLVGHEAAEDFYRSTGWPLISAGLAGPDYDASEMLKQASIYPCFVEKDNYLVMLGIVMPFMRKELEEFLSGENGININSRAYTSLRKSIGTRLPEYLKWWDDRYEQILNEIKSL